MRTTALTTPAPDEQKEVSAVFESTVTYDRHANLGMPVFGRVRGTALPRLWSSTGVTAAIAGQKCALVLDVAGDRSATTDAAVESAFPGPAAWSPPI
jgi:hypothetical protein